VVPVPNPVVWRAPLETEAAGRSLPGRRLPLGGPVHLGALAVGGLVGLLGLGLGSLAWPVVALVGVLGVLVPATISMAVLAVGELCFPKQGSASDLLAGVAAAVAEPFGLGRAFAFSGPARSDSQSGAGAPTYQ
jgi:hypothetical protein